VKLLELFSVIFNPELENITERRWWIYVITFNLDGFKGGTPVVLNLMDHMSGRML
jgi:hypothetical protein